MPSTQGQKRLLVLGAGPGQLPIIRHAVARGLHVTTMDYLPNNIGHRLAHASINCSTADVTEVVRHARALEPNGIVTFSSDVATAALAAATTRLGLPGPPVEVVARTANKAAFRAFQHNAGFLAPEFVRCRSWTEAASWLKGQRGLVVFKPADSSGSRGVTIADATEDDTKLEGMFANALSFSRSEEVCLERFVDGVEVGGDGFMLGGELVFSAITRKHKKGCVVFGHSLPTSLGINDQERVRETLREHCVALGYSNGPFNFDVIPGDEPVVLELSPRAGGNGISAVILRATGVDLVAANIAFALAEVISLEPLPEVIPCGSMVIGTTRGGIVTTVPSLDEVLSKHESIFEVEYYVGPGAKVSAMEHGGHSLGHVLFELGAFSYENTISKIENDVRVRVK